MSTESVTLNPIFSIWITVLVAGLLSIFFIFKEIQRARNFVFLRVAMQVVIIFSLLGFVVRPSYKGHARSESILLLTNGFNQRKADSLVEKYSLTVMQTKDAAPYRDAKKISSWHQLAEISSAIQFVLGEGIPDYALDEFKGLDFDFIPGNQSPGIVSLELKKLKVNFPSLLSGEFRSNNSSNSLLLMGPGGIEDSTNTNGNGIIPFSFQIKPKQSGKFSYRLITKKNGKVVSEQNLPLEVFPEEQLKIVFIQQYPTFETRYLKNYLSEKGHAVTIRYQVSKHTFRYEFANAENIAVPVINGSLLNSFDLLVISPEAYQAMGAGEKQALMSSIKGGLGVLLLFTQPPSKKLKEIFPLETISVKSDTSTFTLPYGIEKYTLPAVPTRVANSPAVEMIASDNYRNLLAGYFDNYFGKIGFQFLNETYRLALEGKPNEYARLWVPLINGIARSKQNEFKISITSPFPLYPNRPVSVDVISSAKTPELFLDSVRVPVKEDVTINNFWHGTVWLNQEGWHTFHLQDSTHLNFYISRESEWNSINLNNQARRNRTYLNSANHMESSEIKFHRLPPLLFFLTFLLASGTLWLLAKI